MIKQIFISLIVVGLIVISGTATNSFAKENNPKETAKQSIQYIDKAISDIKKEDLEGANQSFQLFKQEWTQMKAGIQKDSLYAHGKIEREIAAISIALLNEDKKNAEESLESLKSFLNQYSKGQLTDKPQSDKKISLSSYVKLLENTKKTLESKDVAKGKAQVQELTSQWLSVEGNVVGKSQTVYNNSERRLVELDSSLSNPKEVNKSIEIIDKMIIDLKPLVNTSYSMWDAALIPIREGVEALLVIGALLTITKKGPSNTGNRWVWGGASLGILCSLVIGFLVTYVLNSATFGQNNFLINGFSGVVASLMLLYVSYWLHSNSNVEKWNKFINGKTAQALSNGKMFSFALLAFLAILREGIETVLFLIGMASQMSSSQLILGIAIGFGVLIAIGIFMLKIGVKLPLKPFFFISSIIVFYMCLKFMGSGIHSLQLSGIIPSLSTNVIPTIDVLSIYPSWYSTLPQLLIIGFALLILVVQKKKKNNTNNTDQKNQGVI
ncbi:FTR1 family protein [Priestia megaterium]|uniref:FTR1 family protein n=1 Tax=Priestia megaterium TaxID=1404 RepID=UPI002570AF84|nr:FTR1 family protein [Priestia megaterium]WJD83645.1 FTR1 family protein [Priestia megaterium]